jgi:hypothetical protein
MKDHKNSKEVIYKKHNVNSLFDKAIKINPKRKSDDITTKSKLLLMAKTNSNMETAGDSEIKKFYHKSSMAIPKQKKICIKFKDLVIDSVKNEDSNSHLELALMIKKGKIHRNKFKKKYSKCDNGNPSIKIEQLQKSKSISKVILGSNEKENITIKKIKKIFCCF